MSEPATSTTTPRSREIAWRLFAHELTSSSVEEKGTGEKAPTHLITPLGARVSRILVVGTLTQIEPRGREDAPLWRARLSDPTGGYTITAGMYQPRALAFLAQARPPCPAVVVGKAHLFTGREGTPLVSVRAEEIAPAVGRDEARWREETSRHTLQRISLLSELADGSAAEHDPAVWVAKGYPRRFVESALSSRGAYPALDLEPFRASARRAAGAPEPPPVPAPGSGPWRGTT